MLLIGLLKDYGHSSLFTKIGCVFNVSLLICTTVCVTCPRQRRKKKKCVTRCHASNNCLINVMQFDVKHDKLPISQKFKLLGNGEFNHLTIILTF